jgi:hypothetical protein
MAKRAIYGLNCATADSPSALSPQDSHTSMIRERPSSNGVGFPSCPRHGMFRERLYLGASAGMFSVQMSQVVVSTVSRAMSQRYHDTSSSCKSLDDIPNL